MKTTPVSNFALFLSCALVACGVVSSVISTIEVGPSPWAVSTGFVGGGFGVLLVAVLKKNF
jgi:hypothetical protein